MVLLEIVEEKREKEEREERRRRGGREVKVVILEKEESSFCARFEILFVDQYTIFQVMENAGFSKVDQRRYDLPFDSSDNWVFKVTSIFLPI